VIHGLPELLTSVEEQVLRTAVLHCGEEPFTSEKIEAASAGRMTGFAVELGIERLRERGIIETRKKAWGEVIHTIAPGLFVSWQKVFVPGLGEASDALSVKEDQVELIYEPRKRFASLLAIFLAEAANRGLALTQKGTFHKKDLQRIEERISVPPEELEGLEISYVQQEKLGKSTAILYDAALRLKLLRHGIGAVEIAKESLDAWLSQPRTAIDRQLFDLWWDVLMPNDVWLQHAGAAIRNLPEGCWCRVGRLVRELLNAGVKTGGRNEQEAARALTAYWLKPMAAFGWLELGRDRTGTESEHEGIFAVRKPEPLEEEDSWYVQPDFEVIVPPTVPVSALWELEAFAEYTGGDTVDRYKITKESWQRAMDLGRKPDKLLHILNGYSAFGVPEPVETSLRQWSDIYGAVTIEEAVLLRCKHERDASFLANDEEVSPYIVARLNERDMMVSKFHVKELKDALRRRGFAPREAVQAYEEESARQAGEGLQLQGIIYSRRNAALFPIDPAPEGAEPLRKKLDQIPSAWVKTYRKYHSTTLREIVETAIDIRVAVRTTVGGREVHIVPKQLVQRGKDWVVQGYIDGEETDVSPVEFEEIQLLLPDES